MKIVYDVELRRPGCAIIQAAMGGDRSIANEFDTATWLTFPTPNMGLYEVTQKQLDYLVKTSKKDNSDG